MKVLHCLFCACKIGAGFRTCCSRRGRTKFWLMLWETPSRSWMMSVTERPTMRKTMRPSKKRRATKMMHRPNGGRDCFPYPRRREHHLQGLDTYVAARPIVLLPPGFIATKSVLLCERHISESEASIPHKISQKRTTLLNTIARKQITQYQRLGF